MVVQQLNNGDFAQRQVVRRQNVQMIFVDETSINSINNE